MKFLFTIAILVFAVSTTVHLATLFGIDVIAHWPAVWWMHLVVMVMVGVSATKKAERGHAAPRSATRIRWRDLGSGVPTWMAIIGKILFTYALVNFAWFLIQMGGGEPEIVNGHKVLSSHGRVIRPLTDDEYAQDLAWEMRGFSGFWMIFSWAAVAMLVAARKTAEQAEPETARPASPTP